MSGVWPTLLPVPQYTAATRDRPRDRVTSPGWRRRRTVGVARWTRCARCVRLALSSSASSCWLRTRSTASTGSTAIRRRRVAPARSRSPAGPDSRHASNNSLYSSGSQCLFQVAYLFWVCVEILPKKMPELPHLFFWGGEFHPPPKKTYNPPPNDYQIVWRDEQTKDRQKPQIFDSHDGLRSPSLTDLGMVMEYLKHVLASPKQFGVWHSVGARGRLIFGVTWPTNLNPQNSGTRLLDRISQNFNTWSNTKLSTILKMLF